MTRPVIDPHLHLFNLTGGQYAWLRPGNPPHWPDKGRICRDFGEADLRLDDDLTLAGFVHIEAGFDNQAPWREVAWLEQHCRRPFRSIGGVNLLDPAFDKTLERLAAYRSVVGARDILDDRAADVLTEPQVQRNLGLMAARGWLFEAQLSLADLAGVNALCDTLTAHPDLRVVINHGGFPPVEAPWRWLQGVQRLAAFDRCAIKCSGWEMTDRQWQSAWARDRLADILRHFGRERVMLASNFPLCTFSYSYSDYWSVCRSALGLSGLQFAALSHETAARWYRLPC